MRTLIVYDSAYGNTAKIAEAIGSAITGEIKMARPGGVNPAGLKTFDLIIAGSPTQGGRPTQAMQDFLDKIPDLGIKGVNAAAFDTRYSTQLVRVFGYAADRMAHDLERLGGIPVASPEGFFVKGKKGPLKAGELERAAGWAQDIVNSMKNQQEDNNENDA